MLSANTALFNDLMDYLLTQLKKSSNHSTTRTFIQCIGAIWYSSLNVRFSYVNLDCELSPFLSKFSKAEGCVGSVVSK